MPIVAQFGFFTALLELAATAIGAGVVVGGFLSAAVGVVTRQSRREAGGNALIDVFWGGLLGMFCLCADLIVRCTQWL
jgi:F0F1-type ATP synthase membrane subunit c/vacuolar-type H+-ATPase subunit K